MTKEEKKLMKQRFDNKWKQFKKFDSCKYERCFIKYIRKRDNLILIKSDTEIDYVQLRFDNKEQFNIIFEAIKSLEDESISINEDK